MGEGGAGRFGEIENYDSERVKEGGGGREINASFIGNQ